MRLNVEGLEAKLREARLVARHERKTRDGAQESKIRVARRRKLELHAAKLRRALFEVGAVAERTLPRAFGQKAADVDVGENEFRLVGKARRLCEQRAILMDHRLAVPGEVSGRLALPCGRIDIGRKAARRMRRAKRLPEVGLADDGVRRREVDEHRGACERGARGRRDRNPNVLANLHMDREPREIARLDEDVGAKGRDLARDRNLFAGNVPARGEMPLLVKLAVVRQIDFRRDGQNPPAQDRDGAVVEPPEAPQRRADDDERMNVARGRNDGGKSRLDRAKQRVLLQKIIDGVGRNPQFREKHKRRARPASLQRHLDRARGVEGGVRDTHARRRRRDADEAVVVQTEERMGHQVSRERPIRRVRFQPGSISPADNAQ